MACAESASPAHDQHHVRRHDLELTVEPADQVAAAQAVQEPGAGVEVEPGDGLAVPLERPLPVRSVGIERLVVRGHHQDPRHVTGSGSRNCMSWSRR